MSIVAAIPFIGQALDSVFGGLDKLFTSDDERMKAQHAILMAFQPVILVLVQAQAEFDKMRAQIEMAAMQSGDAFVRRVRPALMCATFLAWIGIEGWLLYLAGPTNFQYVSEAAQRAFYTFMVIGGFFTATRGGEKIVSKWMNGKNGVK